MCNGRGEEEGGKKDVQVAGGSKDDPRTSHCAVDDAGVLVDIGWHKGTGVVTILSVSGGRPIKKKATSNNTLLGG